MINIIEELLSLDKGRKRGPDDQMKGCAFLGDHIERIRCLVFIPRQLSQEQDWASRLSPAFRREMLKDELVATLARGRNYKASFFGKDLFAFEISKPVISPDFEISTTTLGANSTLFQFFFRLS